MGNPDIDQRKFTFCPKLTELPVSLLIVECFSCNKFFAACCPHESFGGDWAGPQYPTCHHSPLVFTDGACSNNGRYGAKAGLGITIGGNEEHCWSIPVDDTVDHGAPRTSQRAELLAAIEGLKKLGEAHRIDEALGDEENSSTSHADSEEEEPSQYIVVTDSEYVVKGITDWFPKWRRRGWRTSQGKQPTNLDLFLKLDEHATNLEQDGVAVGFWHIGREFNHMADELAKSAAYD